ncbi:MAG: PEP-CTERM sorting domain-containing protein [Planctomycetota bacterium]
MTTTMKHLLALPAALFAAGAILTTPAWAANTVWQGDSTTDPNDWFDETNWSNGVPGLGDTARFNNQSDTGLIVIDENDATISNLDPRNAPPSPLQFTTNTGQELILRGGIIGKTARFDFDLQVNLADLGSARSVDMWFTNAGDGASSFDSGLNINNVSPTFRSSSFSDQSIVFTTPVTGSGSLTFEQPGNSSSTSTIEMNAANTYTGSTTIDDGDLVLSGSLSNSNITIGDDDATQLASLAGDSTSNGTLFFNIDGTNSDLITLNSDGTLDITDLNIDIEEAGAGATEANYIIADYAAGTLTGSEFASVIDLPSGYAIDYDFNGNSQIALTENFVIPEPGTLGLIAAGSVLLLGRRRRA